MTGKPVSFYNVDTHLKTLTKNALVESKGNRTKASKLLGISIRTLRNWINRYDLADEVPRPRSQSTAL